MLSYIQLFKRITDLEKWLNEIGHQNNFDIEENTNKLICKICGAKLKPYKKSTIEEHHKTDKHRKFDNSDYPSQYTPSEEADVSQQPNFSHLQYREHAIHNPYAGNPLFHDTHSGVYRNTERRTDLENWLNKIGHQNNFDIEISLKRASHVLRHIQNKKHRENFKKGKNLKYIGYLLTKNEENKNKQEAELAPLPESLPYPEYAYEASDFYDYGYPSGYGDQTSDFYQPVTFTGNPPEFSFHHNLSEEEYQRQLEQA
uniref:Uncharacterized protein n=1 Tax=Meloidogyne javanica TaxID=6303 RepID=A0A915LTF6_MELJA